MGTPGRYAGMTIEQGDARKAIIRARWETEMRVDAIVALVNDDGLTPWVATQVRKAATRMHLHRPKTWRRIARADTGNPDDHDDPDDSEEFVAGKRLTGDDLHRWSLSATKCRFDNVAIKTQLSSGWAKRGPACREARRHD